ncbi:MAG: NAD(P)/FAD-dependent oxidoreductase [Victivallaceae bacterium]|nr:NAD(P)/FAD-dependent oxidoreductase [Victivallaceae bacterium]
MSDKTIDYLIIGGSVAGSVLAAKLAEHGTTLFVDRHKPGTLMNCGGGMPQKVFDAFAIDIPTLPISQGIMKIGDKEYSFPCHYLVVNRSEFDRALYQKACNAGAEFRQLSFLGYDAETKVADFSEHGQTVTLKYHKLILANGFHPAKEPFSGAAKTADCGAARVEIIDTETSYKAAFYFEIYQKTPGYSWIFPMPDGRINIGTGGFRPDFDFKNIFEQFKITENITGKVEVKGGGVLPLKPAGIIQQGDVSLFGDSAGMITALNGEGLMHIERFSDKYVQDLVAGRNLNWLWWRSPTYWYLMMASICLKSFLLIDKIFKIQLYSYACRLVIIVRNLLPR